MTGKSERHATEWKSWDCFPRTYRGSASINGKYRGIMLSSTESWGKEPLELFLGERQTLGECGWLLLSKHSSCHQNRMKRLACYHGYGVLFCIIVLFCTIVLFRLFW